MSSEVYQVDLVAALFGGFMVIWLATASDSEQPSVERHQHYAVLEMTIDQGAGPIAVLPSSLLGRSCVPGTVVDELRQSLGQRVFGCSRFKGRANTVVEKLLDGDRFTENLRYAFLDNPPSTDDLANQLGTSTARILGIRTPQVQLAPLGYSYQWLSDRGAAFPIVPSVAQVTFFSCMPAFATCTERGTVEHRQDASPLAVWSVQNPESLRPLNRLTLLIEEAAGGPTEPAHPFVYDRIFRGNAVHQRMAAAGSNSFVPIVSAIAWAAQLSPGQMLRLTADSVGLAVGQPIQARLCILGPSGKQCFATLPGATFSPSLELQRS
jgi:hypothetical protein